MAWNIWLFALLFTSTLGITVTTTIGYATGATDRSPGRYAAVIAFAVIAANAAGLLLLRAARTRK